MVLLPRFHAVWMPEVNSAPNCTTRVPYQAMNVRKCRKPGNDFFLIICGCDSFFFSTLHLPKMECQHCHSPRFFCFCFCPLVWMSIGATQVCPVKERQEQSLHVVVQNLQKQVKFWCELWIMLTLDLFSHGNLMWFATRGVPELHNR